MSGLITIKDIAKELSLAPSTVSRALNNHPDINEKTRKLVKETADRLGYRINRQAQGFRMSRSYTIGVLVPSLSQHFFSTLLSSIQEVMAREGYQVFVYQTNEDAQQEIDGMDALIGARVDGILLSVVQSADNSDHLRKLIGTGVPTVLFDRVRSGIETSSVESDDFQGAYLATTHLIERGCQKIAHLAGPPQLENSINRRKGYIKALTDQGMEVDEQLIYTFKSWLSTAREGIDYLRETAPDVDGIVSVNDELAVEAILYLTELGIKVPDQIKMVGFGDFPIAKIVSPPLTTIRHQPDAIGREAAALLLSGIQNKDKQVRERKVIPVSLVTRGSS